MKVIKNNTLLFENCDVISATSKSSSSKQNSLPTVKEVAKTETKSNSNFSSTSASNFSYFELHGIQNSPDYLKILRENHKMKPKKRLGLLEKQFAVAKTIILSETRREDFVLEHFYDDPVTLNSNKNENKIYSPNGKENAKKDPARNLLSQKEKADKTKIDDNLKSVKDLSPITKNPDKSSSVSKKRPTDSFIDELVEYQETFISSEVNFLSAQKVLQREFVSRNLPPIELKRFNGDPEQWPEFIENFYSRVHRMASLDDYLRMDRLLSVLEGEAKRSIQSVGSSRIFYVTALKTLKRDFGNLIIVAHLRMKSLFEFPLIKANDRIALRNCHLKLKITITWFQSIAYNVPIKSSENLAKALICLPHSIRNEFYKATRNFALLDGDVDLTSLEKWLEHRLKSFFNPIASIIAARETKTNNPLGTFIKPRLRNKLIF